MTFLHPALLAAGLAAVSIPIIIHLLMHRRRKPVMWGAMRFLVEAYRRQRKRLMLEKWLLLAARCLLVALVALAIGRPLLGSLTGAGAGRTVYLLIDNSLAASARDADGRSALQRHKAAARGLIDSLRVGRSGESDRVALIGLAGPAEGVVLPASANIGSVQGLIDALEAQDSRADLPGALAMVAEAMGAPAGSGPESGSACSTLAHSAPDRTLVVVLSDFLEGSLDLSAAGDLLGASRLLDGVRVIASEPAAAGPGNVAITGLEPLRSVLIDAARSAGSPSAEVTDLVRVSLRRTGEGTSGAGTTTVRARIVPAEGGAAAVSAESPSERVIVRWAPGQEGAVAIVPVRVDRKALGMHGAERGAGGVGGAGGQGAPAGTVIAASIDDDAVSGDNRWRRPVEVREALRVGIISPIRFGGGERADRLDPAAWARLALLPAGEGAGIDVVDIEPAALDGARLAGLDAVVLPRPDQINEAGWARIKLFVDGGGLALIMPPPNVSVHLWGDAMSRGLGTGWSVARESRNVQGQRLAHPSREGSDGAENAPRASADRGAESTGGLLALVSGELDDLITPVTVSRVVPMDPAAPEGGEPLLKLTDGTIVAWAGALGAGGSDAKPGRGLVVYLGVPLDLDWSDLPAKPLMVPLMQEIVRQGVGRARGTFIAVAGSRPGAPDRTTELVSLADPTLGDAAAAPGAALPARERVRVNSAGTGPAVAAEPVRRAALFKAIDERGATRGLVAVNADARAGRTAASTRDGVGAWLRASVSGHGDASAPGASGVLWIGPGGTEIGGGGMAALLGRTDGGSPASLPLLLGALGLAVLELWMARRASHAELRSDDGVLTPGGAVGGGGGGAGDAAALASPRMGAGGEA